MTQATTRYPSTIKNDIAAELQRHPSEIDWKLLRELIDELEAVTT